MSIVQAMVLLLCCRLLFVDKNNEASEIISNWNYFAMLASRHLQPELDGQMSARRQTLNPRFKDLMRRAARDHEASRVAVSILKADSRVAQALERSLAGAGMTLPQFNLLMELAAAPGAQLPLYEINARLVSTPPNTSWLCNRLQERRLLERHRHPDDARVVVVELTEKGWSALAKAAPLVFHQEKELLRGYSKAELRSLAAMLSRLLEGQD